MPRKTQECQMVGIVGPERGEALLPMSAHARCALQRHRQHSGGDFDRVSTVVALSPAAKIPLGYPEPTPNGMTESSMSTGRSASGDSDPPRGEQPTTPA